MSKIKLYDFEEFPQNNLKYGGLAGKKQGVIIDDQNVLLKFPTFLAEIKDSSESKLKNVELKYASSQFSEYLGSHFYEMLGYDVHKTMLGYYKGFLVVGCVDFNDYQNRLHLIEFRNYLTTYSQDISEFDPAAHHSSSNIVRLLEVFKDSMLSKDIQKGLEDRFFEMLVIDAILGNPDRHPGNFGLMQRYSEASNLNAEFVRLSPIYDLGNSLNSKLSDKKIQMTLSSQSEFQKYAYLAQTTPYVFMKAIQENGEIRFKQKTLNPYQLIVRSDKKLENFLKSDEQTYQKFLQICEKCDQALLRVIPKVKEKYQEFCDLIDEAAKVPYQEEGQHMKENIVFSQSKANFIKSLVQYRVEQVLIPAYEKLQKKQQNPNKNLDEMIITSTPTRKKFNR